MLNKFLKIDKPETSRRGRREAVAVESSNELDLKLDEIVKYMPNLLNFENKRSYFV